MQKLFAVLLILVVVLVTVLLILAVILVLIVVLVLITVFHDELPSKRFSGVPRRSSISRSVSFILRLKEDTG